MKKYLMIVTSLACGLHMTYAASAANLSPYQYNPKQPPVEIDLSALDEVEAQQKPAAPASAGNAEVSPPMALTPPAAAPQQLEQQPAQEAAEIPAASAPADPTETFLDKIMANHLPPGTKKKPVKAPASVTPPAPVRKPAVPVAEAPAEVKPAAEPAPTAAVETPKTEEKPAEAQAAPEAPAAEIKPAAEPAPVAAAEAPKTEENPAEAQTAPETPAEAKPSEEKPAGPVVRERRRKTSETAAPAQAEMAVAFDKTSSELSPAAQKDLDAIITKIKDMPDQRIQLVAHATGADGNPSDARRMSLSRGLMVRSYLMEKGISPSRLDVRALGAEGDTPPSDQVELVFVK
ncbi:MAG: OmpA family protein [Alphaproteobacteria bacterium]|nr:OmpA family protein [Alphaproteobacteria bacterium]